MSSTTSNRLRRKPNEHRRRTKCPVCKESGDWFAGKYGPFCSHRCKLIDLGKWLGEEHAISEPLRPGHLD
ncbi:MAG: DNA gyrase inhibitor YacG [Verrucomicrobiota bacterium]